MIQSMSQALSHPLTLSLTLSPSHTPPPTPTAHPTRARYCAPVTHSSTQSVHNDAHLGSFGGFSNTCLLLLRFRRFLKAALLLACRRQMADVAAKVARSQRETRPLVLSHPCRISFPKCARAHAHRYSAKMSQNRWQEHNR